MNKEKFKTGDLIAFKHPDIPLPEIQVVVIENRGKEVEVMSTLLVPFQHSGIFDTERMNPCIVVKSAKKAIPEESHRNWKKGQKLVCSIGRGILVAAFDGIIVLKTENGEYITGGASFFKEDKTWVVQKILFGLFVFVTLSLITSWITFLCIHVWSRV